MIISKLGYGYVEIADSTECRTEKDTRMNQINLQNEKI